MNDLLIIDMLPTYGLLFYLLISVFVFVGMPWSAPEDLGSWPAAFCRRRVLGCFRARRRVRCAGVYHGSAFGAAGYGRLLPHVPARSSDLPAGIVHHTICLRRRCRVSGKVTWYNGWHIFSNRLVATVEMAETLKISLRFCAERER